MSTRGAYGFRINGVDKVTYNHSDSYPKWLGAIVFNFFNGKSDEELKKIASNIILVNDDEPTSGQIAICNRYDFIELGVSQGTVEEWYCLLRGTQSDLNIYTDDYNKDEMENALVSFPYMIDSSDFLAGSLFCEYVYIFNIDKKVLEVYKGFNKNPKARGRYASITTEGDEYCGVRLVMNISFDVLRKTSEKRFVSKMERACEK
jgi:hypothetical protein